MSVSRILARSLGKVLLAPSLILWVFALLLLMALPASLAMREIISDSIGASAVSENLRVGFDLDWWGEFLHENVGFGTTFGPAVTEGLPVLTNLETFLDGRLVASGPPVLWSALFFLLVWIFLQGGIIDRYASPEAPHSRERLFSRSGRSFFRMLRLALLAAVGYWGIFIFFGTRLHRWKDNFFRDSTSEWPVIFATVVAYLLLFVLWWVFSLGIDYAKVALVVEQRRSAFFSAMRGFGFVLTHPVHCFGLSAIVMLLMLLFGTIYFFLAPGPNQATWSGIGVAFLIGQVYLLLRVTTRLWGISTQATFFNTAEASRPEPQFLPSKPGEVYRPTPTALVPMPEPGTVVTPEPDDEGRQTEPVEEPEKPSSS